MTPLTHKPTVVVLSGILLHLCLGYLTTIDKFNPHSPSLLSSDVRVGQFLQLRRYERWNYWSDYKLGFPDVSIGFIFPTFRFVVRKCNTSSEVFSKDTSYLSTACFYQHVALNCARLHYSQYSDSSEADEAHSEGFCFDTFNVLFRIQYSIFFVPPFRNASPKNGSSDQPDGTLDEKNLRYIRSVFKECSRAARNWCRVMRVPNHRCPAPYRFCGFGQFSEMFLRAQLHRSKHRFITGISDSTSLSAMFLYFYCQQKWVNGEPMCPNPCDPTRNPCLTKKNTYLHRCLTINNGVHKSDFKCMCLEGFRWDTYSLECREHNLCLESEADGYPCHRPGTARCLYAAQQANTPTHSCSCLERFMGITCDTVRDPCVQRFDRKLPAGRDACRSRQGGRCMSRMASDYYTCRCPDGWGYNVQLKFPNCFKKFYGCDRVLCFNGGKCKESPDGTVVLCVCPGEWEGQHCETFRRREWLHWEPWTTCSVDCGQGWNFRRRLCRTGLDSDCGGNAQEIRECEAPCEGLEEKYIPIIKMLQYLQLMLIAIAAITFLLALVLRFRLPLIKELITDKRINKEKDMIKQLRQEEEQKFEEFVVGAMEKLEL